MSRRKSRHKDKPVQVQTVDKGITRATPERIKRAGVGGVETGHSGSERIVASPLDRLRSMGAITTREFEAGDKFRGTAYLAAIDPGAIGIDWNAAGGAGRSAKAPSMFTVQHIADARLDYRAIGKEITGVVWDVLQLALVKEVSLATIGRNVFTRMPEKDAAIAGQAGLRVALGALADWYGL